MTKSFLKILVVIGFCLPFILRANPSPANVHDKIVAQAESALARHDYREALRWIDAGFKRFPKDQALRDLEAKIVKERRETVEVLNIQPHGGVL